MYPFLHLLPDGTLFIFVSKSSQVFDVSKDEPVKSLPTLDGLHRTYPNTGGSVVLPMRPETDYNPTIMICGGGAREAVDSPGEKTCGMIQPLAETPKWKMTSMPEGRCMVEGTLLLDGTVLWINSVVTGAQGFGLGGTAAFDALIYDPDHDSWTKAGTSNIARVYHSVALMLLDGTILVAGSNPNEMPLRLEEIDATNQYRKFPTEMRIERWIPPYLRGQRAKRRPSNIVVETNSLKIKGSSFSLCFESNDTPAEIKVVLYHGGFVTHSIHMGQVMVYLRVLSVDVSQPKLTHVVVDMPNIALAPGPYVLYVMVDGVPGLGQFVTLEL